MSHTLTTTFISLAISACLSYLFMLPRPCHTPQIGPSPSPRTPGIESVDPTENAHSNSVPSVNSVHSVDSIKLVSADLAAPIDTTPLVDPIYSGDHIGVVEPTDITDCDCASPSTTTTDDSTEQTMSNFVQEPRRQAPMPDTPPHTPSQHKENAVVRGGRPSGIYTVLNGPPPLTPDGSPHPGYSSSPPLVSPEDMPGVGSGTIGLGLGFNNAFEEKKFPLSVAEEKEAEMERHRAARVSPTSLFASPTISGNKSQRKQPMTTTLAYLFRVPRRMRPALLIATSLVVFGLILISRSVSAANESQRMNIMIRQAQSRASNGQVGTRYVQSDSAMLEASERKPIAHDSGISRQRHPKIGGTSIKLTPEDELLALIGFITAATGNSLPVSVDPSQPVEPSVLLGFDPTAPSATEDLEFLKEEVNMQYPLVLMGKMREPWHVAMVRLLEQYKIVPRPLIVDVDQRRDTERFVPVIGRLLQTNELPQLILQGKSIGSAQDILNMEAEELTALLTANEAVTMRPLTDKELKGGGHGTKDGKIKAERERLLRPAPIDVM